MTSKNYPKHERRVRLLNFCWRHENRCDLNKAPNGFFIRLLPRDKDGAGNFFFSTGVLSNNKATFIESGWIIFSHRKGKGRFLSGRYGGIIEVRVKIYIFFRSRKRCGWWWILLDFFGVVKQFLLCVRLL